MGEKITTLGELINERAKASPGGIFLLSPETGRRLTFGGLAEQTECLARRFGGLGLGRGDKVAFLLDNGLFTAQLFLGVMAGGYVAVPLNPRAGVSSLAHTLEHSDAKVVFVEAQYQELCRQVLGEVKRAVAVVAADIDALATAEAGELAPGEARVVAPGEARVVAPAAEDVALLMYTSGSTGKPKAAVHTHRTVLAHGANSVAAHQLTAEDCSLLVLPLYHINAECVTLIPTLLSGGTVVIPHHFSVSHFWDWMADGHCTWSAVVPTIISQLLDWKDPRGGRRQEMFRRIRFMRSSSAPLSPALHREFLAKFDVWLIQAMGSSECGNIFSNPQRPGENKIGSPGLPWGFEVRIVNPEGEEMAVGEPGEVLLRGPALMKGYYKDPEGTATVVDGEGWFHTGDLAYRDADGYLFVVGRSKELIIKGGVNIAPKQIDEVLESHPAVLEAAAVGVADRYVGEEVVAFVVLRADKTLTESELLSHCEARLGAFKTPARIYFAKDLPKGPSGKVQRLKLQERVPQGVKEAVAEPVVAEPGAKPTPIEQTIAGIWMELLKQPHVGLQSNFFSLGGHSLLAIQSLSKLRERLPVTLSLSDFFEHATVAQQAALIRRRLRPEGEPGFAATVDWEREVLEQIGAPTAAEGIPQRDRSQPCPLSPAQERLWFLEQFNPGVPVYNESEAVRLEGPLDVEALERALNMIVARHEILRSTIRVAGDQPQLMVHDKWALKFKRIDLSGWSPEQRSAEVERLLIDGPKAPYQLQNEPGVRAALIRLGHEEHVFILMVHHIICDRLSLGVLWHELTKLYGAFSHHRPSPLPALRIQYGDYATWQQHQIKTANFDQELNFWRQYLRDVPEVLDLPTDRPRPQIFSYRGLKRQFSIGPALARSFKEFSRREQASLFTVLATAFNVLLSRYSGQKDIPLGINVADRDRPEIQPLIGFFVDTQVLRTDLAGNPTFRELMARVQKSVLSVYSHRSVPFGKVVETLNPERNLGYAPLFQVMLTWRDRDSQLQFIGFPGFKVEPLLSQSLISKFDLQMFITDAGEDILLEMEYSTDLFDHARIERMVGHFRSLLAGVVADPGRPLSRLPLLTPEERQQLLVEWNDTAGEDSRERCVHQLFEEQVERTPEAVAVVFKDHQLTYRQLNERANQLAHHLQKLGVVSETLVAIAVERSLEMVVGLLGILKAGGAYVPLDPAYPAKRLNSLLAISRPSWLVTETALAGRFADTNLQLVVLGDLPADLEKDNPKVAGTAQSLAYVLFTSGSTGEPKGVAMPHQALVNLLQWQAGQTRMPLRTLQFASLSFDVSFQEMFTTWQSGGTLVLVDSQTRVNPDALWEYIAQCKIERLFLPVVMLQYLAESAARSSDSASDLREIITAGEQLRITPAIRSLFAVHTGCLLYNHYGPTETHVVTARLLTGDPSLWPELPPIGRPISNTSIYLLDPEMNPVPVGVAGELFIGGIALACGYYNRPELTAEKFIPNPFRTEAGARLYKTGDLARFLPDGDIEYLGRVDSQVKIRGFRVELEEIESQLRQHPVVREAVVVVREDTPGDKRLVAYVTSKNAELLPVSELRAWLQARLPEYMVPLAFVSLERIPLTTNGKIDRKALPKPDLELAAAIQQAAPENSLEKLLSEIWIAELGLEKVGVESNFFELGGHSLLMVRFQNRLNTALKTKVSIVELFQYPTIRSLARHLGAPTSQSAKPRLRLALERARRRSEIMGGQAGKQERHA